MYNASEQLNEAIRGNRRKLLARIKAGEKEITDGFKSIRSTMRSCSSDSITIGGAVSAYTEIEIWKPDFELENTEVEISIGLQLESAVEWVPLGLYTIQKPQNDDGLIKFTAYDRIQSKMSGAYFSKLSYPADGKTVLREISSMTGVPIDTSNLADGVLIQKRMVISEAGFDSSGNAVTNTTFEEPFNGYSYREALGYVAMLYCMFAIADRTGTVVFRWYKQTDYVIGPDRYYDDLVTSELVFFAQAISCRAWNATFTAGTGEKTIELENPVMTQERLNAIYAQIKNLQFLPAGLSFYGDVCVDVGDLITVNDKYGNIVKIPVMSIVQEFDGGLSTKIQSYGGMQAGNTTKGPTLQRLDRTYMELFLVKELIGSKASFDYVYSIDGEFKNLKSDFGSYKTLVSNEFAAANGQITNLSGDFASFKTGEFATLQAKQANFETVTSQSVTAVNGRIDTLAGDFADYKKVIAQDFTATNGQIDTLTGEYASFKEQTVEKLTADRADIEHLKTTTLELDNLIAKKADITELNATNAQIDNLSGQFSSFQTSMSQELITAKGWMLEGAIGDAQISKVSANKLGAGTIDTAIVTVAGTDGRLQIQDNTIQIKDANRVRVQIGKDAGGDYSMSVWDASGQLIWDALGATENTIQRKIIRDRMVADDAAIQALKIDFQSFDTALTQQGVTISGTVVQVGGKTLNVALSEQTQLITEHGETLTDHATRITASENDIKLKVSTQDFNSYKTTVNGELTSAKSRLSTAESSITAMQGKIALKVEQTDIDSAVESIQVGGRNLIVQSKVSNGWVNNSGSITADTNYRASDFISVTPGDTLIFQLWTAGASEQVWVDDTYFDATKKYVTGYNGKYITTNHVMVTYTVPEGASFVRVSYKWKSGWKAKLELGTKATDWTPAPEDIDASITAVDNKFANYSTTAQMQSAINLAKDSITSTVSKTYATQTYADGIKATADSAKKEVYATFNGNGDSKAYCLLCQIKTNQAYINTPTVIEINQRGYGYSLCEIKFASSNSTDPALYSIRKTGTPQWRIVKSATSTWDVYVKKSESWDSITVVGFTKGTVPSVTWICMNADLPNGSTAATQLAGLYTVDSTSGGTAGSDALITSGAAHSAISSVQTIATQTADKFNWLVKSGTSATDFTLTDRTAQLITEKLTIKDSTGASMIISGGKMDINKIFAQDITATGTIRGVTLEGAKGHIGGWTISNQALYCGIGVSEFDENGAEINSVSYDTYIRAAERENDKVFEVKTKRGQAASESVFYVTAKGGLHAENGTISIFNFSPYGFYADFTNDGVSDYRFAKDYFIATAYNASNVRRAYFYADSEMTTQSVNGRAIIFGNDTIDLRTNGAIRVMTETEQVTGVEHVVINPNGTITASGEVQGNIIRSANSVIGSNFVSGGSSYNNGYIELSGATPFIDFHFGNTSTDYTSRIIEWERNRLTIVNGANQTPLQVMGCSNNEASIKYVNNTSGDWWIAGAGTGYADMKKFGFWYGPVSRAVGYIDYSGNFQAGASIYSTGNMHAANGMTGNANGGIYIGTGTIPFIYNAGNSGDVWLQTYVGGGWKWYSIGQGLAAVSSDKRLKDDVADSTVNALPVVKRVKVRSFLRNDTKEYYKIGVVADELEEIDDLLTYGGGYTPDGHPIYKNVNVLQLSVYAVKAIQELDAKVEDTSRNAYGINSRVDGIDAQMNNLRNQLTSAESTISNLRAEVAELRRMIHAA